MSTFKKGDIVKQIVPAIEGTVTGFQIDQEHGIRLLLVEYTNADDEPSSRYFKETEVELVASAEDIAE